MIRIELDRIHLELLLLAGLIAAFAGVVFEPTMRYGVNVVPLVALGVVGVIGLIVLIHRRFTAGDRSRVRGMVWFALVGALLGATVSSVVVGTVRSMALAAAGVGAMCFALGTQFSIVIKSREAAARAALEDLLEDENVFVASEQRQTNGTDTDRQRSDTKPMAEYTPSSANESNSETESDGIDTLRATTFRSESESDDDGEKSERKAETDDTTNEESNSETTDEDSEDRHDVERTDDPGSEHWAQSTADDSGPIPVIRSITSAESSEE